jgi:simple sugar transport system ATP-binding protein
MMVGRGVELSVSKAPAKPGEPVLDVRNLSVLDDTGRTAVEEVTFTVHAGEIVAVAGVQGNGQTELARAITGLATVVMGSIRVDGTDITGSSPKHALRAGIAHIPEDRLRDGLVGSFSIAENMVLDVYDELPFSHSGALDWDTIRQTSTKRMSEFDVRARSNAVPVRTLSGGNQQKVIVARELSRKIRLIVASQPTRGLDVGSIEYVHQRLVQARDAGAAVLLVSVELDEVMALADQIVVMYRGKLTGPYPAGNLSREQIGLLMAGSSPAEVGGGT